MSVCVSRKMSTYHFRAERQRLWPSDDDDDDDDDDLYIIGAVCMSQK